MVVDDAVHLGLGVRRFVALVVPETPVADQIDHDVLVERLAEGERHPGDPDHRLGVIGIDMEDRGLYRLGDIGGVERRAGVERRGGETNLVVHHDMNGAAGVVAAELGQVERLGDDPLTGEGGVAMEQHRQHGVLGAGAAGLLLGAGDSLQYRVDGFEMAGVGDHLDGDLAPVRCGVEPLGSEVVLDVTGEVVALVGILEPDELPEDRRKRLADGVGEHVEPATVGHPDGDILDPRVGGGGQQGVEQRDQALRALQAEALGAEELGVEVALETLGLVELAQDPHLLLDRKLRCRHLGVLLDPQLLVRFLDVHVLDAGGAAVGIAQQPEDPSQIHPGLTGEPTGGELAIEVPQCQSVGERVELGVDDRRILTQWVEVGDEVAPHPVHVDQPECAGLLLRPCPGAGGRVRVDRPPGRDVGDLHRPEDVVVEVVGAEQELMDTGQEQPAFGPLDDAMVVGAGHRQRAADTRIGDGQRIGAFVLGGESDAAHTDDQTLTGHQAGNRLDGSDGTRVGQRGRGVGEVVGGDLAAAGPSHHVLVGEPVLLEVHLVDHLEVGDEQGAGSVLALEVHGQTEVDVVEPDAVGLVIDHPVGGVHRRALHQRLGHGPTDDVGEADLAPVGSPGELVVDDAPVDLEQLGGEGPHRCRRGEVATCVHPLGDGGGTTTKHLFVLERLGGGALCGGRLLGVRIRSSGTRGRRVRCGGLGSSGVGLRCAGLCGGGPCGRGPCGGGGGRRGSSRLGNRGDRRRACSRPCRRCALIAVGE